MTIQQYISLIEYLENTSEETPTDYGFFNESIAETSDDTIVQ